MIDMGAVAVIAACTAVKLIYQLISDDEQLLNQILNLLNY